MATVLPAPGVDLSLTMSPLAMLFGDPTIRLGANSVVRATFTPDGTGVIRAVWQPGVPEVAVEVSGDGGHWLLERAPAFLGLLDDPGDFAPQDPKLRQLWAVFRDDRVGRTATLWHDLAWTIVQQRVHRRDAARQWRRFVESLGDVAPGSPGLHFPPDPLKVARTPIGDLTRIGLDTRRARALHSAALVANQLQRLAAGSVDDARRALSSVDGIGPWTIACLSAFTWGDPDTVIVGDSGIPSLIASTLTGERRADDARMMQILEPFRPHRYRVLRLVFAARTRRTSQW